MPAGWVIGQASCNAVVEGGSHAGVMAAHRFQVVALGRQLSREGLIEGDTQRINIRTCVDGSLDWAAFPDRLQSISVFRRHVTGRPAEIIGSLAAGAERLSCQVEIQEHRLPVGCHEHVGWLDVEVDEVSLMSIVKSVGQASADPAHGLNVGAGADAGWTILSGGPAGRACAWARSKASSTVCAVRFAGGVGRIKAKSRDRTAPP